MFIIHIVAAVVAVVGAATTWKGYACSIIRPLGSLQTVHSAFFCCWWIETKREKNRNNLSLCWAINLMVNWVRCRCDKYLAHSWGIVQKMRYASFIRIYEGKSHKRKRFSLILQSIFFSFSLLWSFVVWAIFAVKVFLLLLVLLVRHTHSHINTKHRRNIINQMLYLERHSFYLLFPCVQRKNSTHFCNYESAWCVICSFITHLHEFLFYYTSNSSPATFLFVRISLKTNTHRTLESIGAVVKPIGKPSGEPCINSNSQ